MYKYILRTRMNVCVSIDRKRERHRFSLCRFILTADTNTFGLGRTGAYAPSFPSALPSAAQHAAERGCRVFTLFVFDHKKLKMRFTKRIRKLIKSDQEAKFKIDHYFWITTCFFVARCVLRAMGAALPEISSRAMSFWKII